MERAPPPPPSPSPAAAALAALDQVLMETPLSLRRPRQDDPVLLHTGLPDSKCFAMFCVCFAFAPFTPRCFAKVFFRRTPPKFRKKFRETLTSYKALAIAGPTRVASVTSRELSSRTIVTTIPHRINFPQPSFEARMKLNRSIKSRRAYCRMIDDCLFWRKKRYFLWAWAIGRSCDACCLIRLRQGASSWQSSYHTP